jgi:hypothetical protein
MNGTGSWEDDVESTDAILAADPDVFWVPVAFTPGKSISADPLKETPPMVLVFVNVAADPDVFWVPVAFTPGKSISADPLKETPPMVLVFVNVAADPDHAVDVNEPVVPPLVPTITSWTLISPEPSLATNLFPVFVVVASAAIVVSDAPV